MNNENQWWNLPPEVIDLILSKLQTSDFRNYYHFCGHPCKEVLNNPGHLATVLRSNYGADIEAFEWEVAPKLTTEEYTRAFNKYSSDVTYIATSLFSFGCKLNTNNEVFKDFQDLMNLVTRLSCSDAHPIIAWLHMKMTEEDTANALKKLKNSPHKGCVKVAVPAWSRHLQHMQQFGICVKFFRDTDPDTRRDIEKCHFEISRCRLEFDLLAHYRLKKLKDLREHVAKFKIYNAGRVSFTSTESYYDYLRSVIFTILRVMQPKRHPAPESPNLLRYYKGETYALLEICYAVIAKILQEEIFDNMVLQTPDRVLQNVTVKVSPQFLIVDDTYISVSQKDFSVSVYNIAQLQRENLTPAVLKSLRYLDVLRRTSHVVNLEKPAMNFANMDALKKNQWSLKKSFTSNERLRFMRSLLILVCSRENLPMSMFQVFGRYFDFYLYYACAKTLLGQAEDYTSDRSQFSAASQALLPQVANSQGANRSKLVLNTRWRYIGLEFGATSATSPDTGNPQPSAFIIPTDSLEVLPIQDMNLPILQPLVFESKLRSFLKWLLRTEGISVVNRFFLWNLIVSESSISFSNTQESETNKDQTGVVPFPI